MSDFEKRKEKKLWSSVTELIAVFSWTVIVYRRIEGGGHTSESLTRRRRKGQGTGVRHGVSKGVEDSHRPPTM
jgi:hypothetical protein